MACLVVSNETIDAIVMAILGGNRSNLLLILNLGETFLPRTEIDPEYDEIWPELGELESVQALGDRLLKHNIEAYKYSRNSEASQDSLSSQYECKLLAKPKYTDMEMLMAIECYLYQIVDHEEETEHPIFKLLKEVSSNLYRDYVRSLPEWGQCVGMWR